MRLNFNHFLDKVYNTHQGKSWNANANNDSMGWHYKLNTTYGKSLASYIPCLSEIFEGSVASMVSGSGGTAFSAMLNEALGASYNGQGGDLISMNANHDRFGYVPLDVGENYGAYQIANYMCNISVRGNQKQITVRATSSNTPVIDGEVVFGARASLVVNGNVTQSQILANGMATFDLPSSQNISLTVSGGWTVRYDYGGAAVPVFHPIFWPFSLNFTDNFKLK